MNRTGGSASWPIARLISVSALSCALSGCFCTERSIIDAEQFRELLLSSDSGVTNPIWGVRDGWSLTIDDKRVKFCISPEERERAESLISPEEHRQLRFKAEAFSAIQNKKWDVPFVDGSGPNAMEIALLVEALNSQDVPHLLGCIANLGATGSDARDAIPKLDALTEHTSPQIAAWAKVALKEIRKDEAHPDRGSETRNRRSFF